MATTVKVDAEAIFAKASAAASAAFEAATPRPMVVGTPKDPLGSLLGGDDGGFDEKQPVYYVSDGLCGFAGVVIKPARGALVTLLKKKDVGYKHYYGGYYVPSYAFAPESRRSQSYERACAASQAAAGVLNEHGLTAYVDSRLD